MQIKINNLNINNIKNLNYQLLLNKSTIITGWSGSGKSSFANALFNEAKRKFILLLPKSEYSFIFKNDEYKATINSLSFTDTPFIVSIENRVTSNTPKSTIGTITGIFKSIRQVFAKEHDKSSEFFSFNIPLSWCPKCKGKSTFRGEICPICNGTRYAKDIEKYKISCGNFGKLNIIDILSMPMEDILTISKNLFLSKKDIIKLENTKKLNISYLSLNRSIITLSGGEYARLILSNYLGLSENIVYMIDEPSIGLDSQNIKNMIRILDELGNNNQIFIIDHNIIMRNATEETIIFGEKSGKEGGRIVSNIEVDKCRNFDKIDSKAFVEFTEIKNRNINLKNIKIPLNSYNVITGESGVGKSSLIHALIPKIEIEKSFEVVHIEQNKLRGITSKSTIATYLGFIDILKSYAKLKIENCKICNGSGLDIDNINCLKCNGTGYDNTFLNKVVNNITVKKILTEPISDTIDRLPEILRIESIKLMTRLSNGYLSLDRKVNTLSGGEFQRLYLAKQLSLIFTSKNKKHHIIFLDEPSKGLSQNYINDLLILLKETIKQHSNITLIAIEHNECMINNADYIMDMGKRRELIDKLYFEKTKKKIIETYEKESIFTSSLKKTEANISFLEAQKQYKNLLKIYSKTAEWIYSNIEYKENLNPVIAIDFEKDNLYSKHTRLYETLNIYPKIIQNIEDENSVFNLTDQSNICKICKGIGKVDTLDLDKIFIDKSKDLFNGLVDKEIIEIIKPYNLTKVKFLFKIIKKEFDFDLAKSYNNMNEQEQIILKYGFLNKSFIMKSKGKTTYQTWRGLNHLINKYLRTYKKNMELKNTLKSDITNIQCPKCKGELFNHKKDTFIDKVSLRKYLQKDGLTTINKFMDEKLFHIYKKEIGHLKLNDDVSLLDKKSQVYLKLLEIAHFSLQGYHIHIKNISDFVNKDEKILSIVKSKNSIYLHDNYLITLTKKELIENLQNKLGIKITSASMVYELFGINAKELRKNITLLKKTKTCEICSGKGKFIIENPIDELDTETIECSKCFGIGIDRKTIETIEINNMSLVEILFGNKFLIHLNKKILSLNKEELQDLMDNL